MGNMVMPQGDSAAFGVDVDDPASNEVICRRLREQACAGHEQGRGDKQCPAGAS